MTFLLSCALVQTILQEPIQASGAPVIRFGGRNSGFMDINDLKQEFKRMPNNPPEPQYLVNMTIGFTNLSGIYPVFDDTYRPWRALLAKRQLVDLMMEGGAQRAFNISKLPFALYSEISDQLDAVIPSHVFDQLTCITFYPRLDIQARLPRESATIWQPEQTSEKLTPDEKEALKSCAQFPLHRNDAHAQEVFDIAAKYAKLPVVKIWGETVPNPTSFEDLQKQALKIYNTWAETERVKIDQRFFAYLERSQIWSDQAALYRCKVFGDLAKASPEVIKYMLDTLVPNYDRYGYPNADSFRAGAKAAPLTSSTGFIATVALSDGRTIRFPIL